MATTKQNPANRAARRAKTRDMQAGPAGKYSTRVMVADREDDRQPRVAPMITKRKKG